MSLSERELIAAIRRRAARGRAKSVVKGIGDDCAVLRLPGGHEALVTTDFSLEGIHFRREWHPPESVGHRCLTRGLSDIAAMGGVPLAAFLSLALPSGLPQKWVDSFLRGLTRLARQFKVELAGGDTATSPGNASRNAGASTATADAALARDDRGKVLADIVVVGSLPRGKAVLRSGARVGDDIFVTGRLGAAAAVLHRLQTQRSLPRATNRRPLATADLGRAAARRHFYPTPRLAAGQWLRERGLPSAMIDISDGLSTDLSHICEESGVGAWIAEKALPVATNASLEEALHGGDDYELLFTAAAARHDRIPDRIAGVPVHWIGTITKAKGMWLVAPDMNRRRELQPRGWEHLK